MVGLIQILCTALIGLTAFTLSRRSISKNDPIQVLVFSGVIFHALIIGPLWLLGMFHGLTWPWAAATTSVLCATLLVYVAWLDGGFALFAENTKVVGRKLFELIPGLRRAMKLSGFPLWIGVSVSLGLWGWLCFGTVFSPARGNADALFYHEPMVAYMMQTGGFDVIDLPAQLQRINGMPRFGEMMQLWFALFTGRTFMEFPNLLAHPLAVASIYGLLRHFRVQKSSAIGWAFCFPMIPGILRLTDGVMVDVFTAGITAAATYCVFVSSDSKPEFRISSVALALLMGTKYHYIEIGTLLTLFLMLRVAHFHIHKNEPGGFIHLCSIAGIVFAGLATVLVRNWIEFQNPIFPAGVNLPTLGIKFVAPDEMKDAWASGKGLDWFGVLDKWSASPFSVAPWTNPGARVEDYGLAAVFLTLPLTWVVVFRNLGRSVTRIRGWGTWSKEHWSGLGLSILLLAVLVSFPSIVRGRYYLGILGLTFIACASLFARPRHREIGRQMAFAAQVLSVIGVLYCAREGWILDPGGVVARLQVPRQEQDFTQRPLRSISRDVGLARIAELTHGKRVGFDETLNLGFFWNDAFSNEVHWLGVSQTLRRADELQVDWLYLERRSVSSLKDPERAKQWEFIGHVLAGKSKVRGRMYRRVTSLSPASNAEVNE